MKRKTIVTIKYNLDDVLEYHYIVFQGQMMKAKYALSQELPVKEWYMNRHPSDDMGERISDTLTWTDLLERMRCGEDIDQIVNVRDTIIRERILDHLASMLNIPYSVIYKLSE